MLVQVEKKGTLPGQKAQKVMNLFSLGVMVLTIVALLPIFFVKVDFVLTYVFICFVFLTILVKKLSDRIFDLIRKIIRE